MIMRLLYTVPDRDLLLIRNDIIKETCIPELRMKDFLQSPFSTSWFGKNNLGDYSYEFCRLSKNSVIEILLVHINKGDSWIKFLLNVFKLSPKLDDIEQLRGVDGLKFHLPPNSLTRMRLRSDEYKVPPFFYMLFYPEHKIGRSYTKIGFDREVQELEKLIKKDMIKLKANPSYLSIYKPIIAKLNVAFDAMIAPAVVRKEAPPSITAERLAREHLLSRSQPARLGMG